MKIRTLLCLACFTTAFACGDDTGDEGASGSSETTNPTTGMTDPTTGVTDPTTGVTDPTTGVTDPTTGVTDPTTGMTSVDSSSGDATADSGSSSGATEESGTSGGDAACQMYCDSFFETCNECKGIDGLNAYADIADCVAACGGFPPDDGMMNGGTDLECRVYHLGMAENCDDVHCPHADVDGSGTCGG